ncbi:MULTISPECIES: hypothetical protein [Rhizobium]|uniref:hypothetical protein n=1 Tax=Rhizobium TaxID=379 RepID=UPI00041053B9|nr:MULTISPECIES: hypothetical protein [Rhizobium]UFS81547.1 hypothetical protein LPB79_25075 [Rhizobium sp. T136]
MTNEFIKRLPDTIIHCSDGGFVEMCRTPQTSIYYIETGDPSSPGMSWEEWVAFARQIIAADEAARAGGAA